MIFKVGDKVKRTKNKDDFDEADCNPNEIYVIKKAILMSPDQYIRLKNLKNEDIDGMWNSEFFSLVHNNPPPKNEEDYYRWLADRR